MCLKNRHFSAVVYFVPCRLHLLYFDTSPSGPSSYIDYTLIITVVSNTSNDTLTYRGYCNIYILRFLPLFFRHMCERDTLIFGAYLPFLIYESGLLQKYGEFYPVLPVILDTAKEKHL
jgi:hypothetical protein